MKGFSEGMSVNVWVDGVERDSVVTSDRGLAYGDGLFETLLVIHGRIILADLHWQRLINGCRRLSVAVDWHKLMSYLNKCLRKNKKKTGIIKVVITRGSGGRGYNPPSKGWRSIIQWFALPDYPEINKMQGVNLYACKMRLGWQPALAGMKHLNRLEQILARQEWSDPGYAEGIICDMDGSLIECTMSNIFFVHNGELITPDLSLCGVAGVMRQWILQLDTLCCDVSVKRVTPEMLKVFDEVFICNSIFGVWPVVSYASYRWRPGGVTRDIQKKVEFLFHDESVD